MSQRNAESRRSLPKKERGPMETAVMKHELAAIIAEAFQIPPRQTREPEEVAERGGGEEQEETVVIQKVQQLLDSSVDENHASALLLRLRDEASFSSSPSQKKKEVTASGTSAPEPAQERSDEYFGGSGNSSRRSGSADGVGLRSKYADLRGEAHRLLFEGGAAKSEEEAEEEAKLDKMSLAELKEMERCLLQLEQTQSQQQQHQGAIASPSPPRNLEKKKKKGEEIEIGGGGGGADDDSPARAPRRLLPHKSALPSLMPQRPPPPAVGGPPLPQVRREGGAFLWRCPICGEDNALVDALHNFRRTAKRRDGLGEEGVAVDKYMLKCRVCECRPATI